MATIIIRNLDGELVERLKLQAQLRSVSTEEEARRLLAKGTQLSRSESQYVPPRSAPASVPTDRAAVG